MTSVTNKKAVYSKYREPEPDYQVPAILPPQLYQLVVQMFLDGTHHATKHNAYSTLVASRDALTKVITDYERKKITDSRQNRR